MSLLHHAGVVPFSPATAQPSAFLFFPARGTGPSTGSPPAIVSYGCGARWHYQITKLPQPLLALPPPASQSSSVVEQIQQVRTEIKVVQSEAELADHLGDIHLQHNQQDTVQGGHTAQPIKFVYDLLSMA